MNVVMYFRWLIVAIIIVYSWLALHEFSHYVVCSTIGGEPYLATILPHPSITCSNIVDEGQLVVKPIQYFIYAIIPYILGLVALVIMYFKEFHVKWVYILASFILLDAVWNYVGAFFKPTDFKQVLIVSKTLFIASAFIVIAIAVISINMLKRRWKEFKAYGQNVYRKT